MTFSHRCNISPDHPALPGHFPSNPIVPGVVLLDQVQQALKAWQPGQRITSIRQVKFLQPLLPGQDLDIQLEQDAERLHFRASRDNVLVLQGEAITGPVPE